MEFTVTEQLVKEYVSDLFAHSAPSYLIYHNLSHTEHVANHALELANYYKLDERACFVLHAAAWFHDVGHIFTEMEMHEDAGAHIMRSFLEKENIHEELIDTISACILATKYPPNPKRLMEGIICDADTWHFGTREFELTDRMMKEEMQLRTNKDLSDWNQVTLRLLKNHRFFTSYCRTKLEEGKKQNIESLQARIKRISY